jgi:hypothetical protein
MSAPSPPGPLSRPAPARRPGEEVSPPVLWLSTEEVP